ncbi:transcription elongation factor TFIIS/CRSP70 [Tanacetum coccineum]
MYKLQHMSDILKETAIEKTVSVLQNPVSKDVNETTRTLVKEWKDMVNETTNNESSTVKKISEKAETQKGSIACYQQCKPVDSRVETGDQKGPARTIIEKNFEASKKKIKMSYKEIECMKKKRRIQLLQLNELPRQDHQIKPVNKRLRR